MARTPAAAAAAAMQSISFPFSHQLVVNFYTITTTRKDKDNGDGNNGGLDDKDPSVGEK